MNAKLKTNLPKIFLLIFSIVFILFLPSPVKLEKCNLLIVLNFIASSILITSIYFFHNKNSYSLVSVSVTIMTIYRLAINIIATKCFMRFLDTEGTIGEIGSYTMGGNFVVGTIFFLIIYLIILFVTIKSVAYTNNNWERKLITFDTFLSGFIFIIQIVYGIQYSKELGLNMEEATYLALIFSTGVTFALRIPALLIAIAISMISINSLKKEFGANLKSADFKLILINVSGLLLACSPFLSLPIGRLLLLAAIFGFFAYKLRNNGLLNFNLFLKKETGQQIIKFAKENQRSHASIVEEALEKRLKLKQ